MNFDLKTWLTGFSLGLAGKPLPLPLAVQKKLVGYSYNGVVLPALPERDKEKYPYAFLFESTQEAIEDFGFTHAVVYTQCLPWVRIVDGKPTDCLFKIDENATIAFLYHSYTYSNGVFTLKYDNKSGRFVRYTRQFYTLIWANCDVSDYESGEIILEQSEPVPVYE